MTAAFDLDGQEFVALNGGPQFTPSPAISFVVNCDAQAAVDEYRQRLSVGGEPHVCGWLKERYGVSWQIVPRALTRMLANGDARRAARVMQAMIKMTRIEIDGLGRALRGP